MIINRLTQMARTSCDQIACRVADSPQPEKPLSVAGGTESVRISDAGRATARAVAPVVRDPDAELTPEQIARLLHRIETGAYDCLEVIDAVARRIQADEDLAFSMFGPSEEEYR